MSSHPIDVHVGRRLRQRRRLLGLTQEKLVKAVSIRFQQIQKYESGANRISASRLWSIAQALEVSVAYFFDGLDTEAMEENYSVNGYDGFQEAPAESILDDKETFDLVRYYYQINKEPRRKLLDLARALTGAD